MNFSSLSIKHMLVGSLLVAVILSSALVGFLGQFSARSLVSDRLESVELPNTLKAIRNDIDKEISVLSSATRQLANNQLLLDWLQRGSPSEQEPLVISTLQNMSRQYNLTNASVANRQTADYWNQDGFLRTLQNDAADGWFFAFTSSGQADSKSLYNEDGTLKLFINYQDTSGIILTGIGVSVQQMVEKLNQQKIAETGFVFLTDGGGTVKIHKNSGYPDNQDLNKLYGSANGRQLLSQRDFSMVEVEVDGEAMFLASSYIESAGWYVVAQVPVDEIFAELNSARLQMLFWILMSTAGFGVLAFALATKIAAPIDKLGRVFAELGQAEADLSVRLRKQSNQELQLVGEGFNAFVEKIQRTVENVSLTSADLRGEADNVAEFAKNSLSLGKTQSDHTGEVVTAISQMGETVEELARNASKAAETANELEDSSVNGRTVSEDAKAAIEKLSTQVETVAEVIHDLAIHTDEIGNVLEVIRGVSEQTNLLALNAAIEAARAGEQGRGFAVVADEVRSLAQRTAESTDEIQKTIDRLQQEAARAVSLVKDSREQAVTGVESVVEAEKALKTITDSAIGLKDINHQVAAATEEQAQVAHVVSRNLKQIQEETSESLNVSSNVARASEALQQLAGKLDKLVEAYRAR